MAISSSYNAELAQIQLASQHVDQVSQQIQSQLSTLYNNIAPLESLWQGGAAASFQQLLAEWQQDAAKINTILGQISEGLLLNFNQYTAAEADNSQIMTATAGQLG